MGIHKLFWRKKSMTCPLDPPKKVAKICPCFACLMQETRHISKIVRNFAAKSLE
jgi:hypothetical protein